MARGKTVAGLIPLLASIIVSPIVYFVGLAVLGAAAVSGDAYQDYKERAEAASTQQEAPQSSAALDLKPVAMEVTAADLFAAYDANEVSADDKYKGRQLAVTGTVAGINKDITDSVYVEIATPNEFSTIHARGIEPAVAAGLTKGSQITVVCEGGGLLIGSPQLDECSVR
ncbi:hypothetical protein IB225_05990 [Pseudoxanthomonas sp. PXM02]|nr:hypothetical protein [Pseudoxanthomonas sp. PXM02]